MNKSRVTPSVTADIFWSFAYSLREYSALPTFGVYLGL